MSDKDRKKKDGEDKNKNNQREREANTNKTPKNNLDTHEPDKSAGKSKV